MFAYAAATQVCHDCSVIMSSLGTSSSCNNMHAVLPNGVQGMSWIFCNEACTSPTPACSIQNLLTEVGVCVSSLIVYCGTIICVVYFVQRACVAYQIDQAAVQPKQLLL